MHQLRSAARRTIATAAMSVAFAGLPSAMGAQTSLMTKAQRDSAAKADSMKHAGHNMPGMKMPGTAGRSDSSQMSGMQMMTPEPLGVSMERMGSGTTWIPDAVVLPSYHAMAGSWDLMLHGFVFGQYNKQGGPRGDDQFGSLNWGMFMASRELAGGRFQLRTMLSVDPATVTNRGYPLLLQSGETYQGQPIVDRQHPHDFWMELGAMYERPITKSVGLMLYGAPAGEPALGAVAFMHRPSAMDNPFAPLSHHWQDATHITFGVATAGLFTHRWRLEGSAFNGRAPDESRWNFDPIKLDSYSGRLSFNPDSSWSFTTGYGWLKSPEALSPDESIHRVTASALHGTRRGPQGQVASSLVWGANAHHGEWSHSVLVESEAILDPSNTLLMRGEFVQKNAEELALDGAPQNLDPELRLNVAALSAGYIREVGKLWGMSLGIGGMGTVNLVPATIESVYGSRTPVGGMVFLRIRPEFKSSGMAGMSHEHH